MLNAFYLNYMQLTLNQTLETCPVSKGRGEWSSTITRNYSGRYLYLSPHR